MAIRIRDLKVVPTKNGGFIITAKRLSQRDVEDIKVFWNNIVQIIGGHYSFKIKKGAGE